MKRNVKSWKYWVFCAGLLAGLFTAFPCHAGPIACDVTTTGDLAPVTGQVTAGSFRAMLIQGMMGNCINNTISFKVQKVTMNAPLGAGIFAISKGMVIQPAPGMLPIDVVVKYDAAGMAAGCAAPSPFDDCFAYLPTSNVSIHNINVSIDPTGINAPMRGLCLDQDPNLVVLPDQPTNNQVVVDGSSFSGFFEGGVDLSPLVDGVKITKSTFHKSGEGIIVEVNPTSGTPSAPLMGGSDEAMYALVDNAGAVKEYHLLGIAPVTGGIVTTEFFQADAKAGGKYLQDCTMHNTDLIAGKWNIDCVLPKSLVLPYDYAVTVTNKGGMTSMFATGTIPADITKTTAEPVTDVQTKVDPPQVAIVDGKDNPVKTDKQSGNGDVVTDEFKLDAISPASGGGCSLIR